MRIGIDASDWLNQRGLGRYVRCLTEQLALNSELAVTLFSPEDLSGRVSFNCDLRSDARRLPWYSWRLPRLARKHPVDVMFFPTNHAWWFGPAPSVVTIHDLACLHFPDKIFQSRREARYEAMRLRWFARHAAQISCVSEFTKADIVAKLGCSPNKISVVPSAVTDVFWRPPALDAAEVRDKFGLGARPFLLYTGGLDFRKNVMALVKAFALLVQRDYDHMLVLVGEYGSRRSYFPDVDGLVRELGLEEHVKRLSGVSDEELRSLYSEAALFVFPTLFEGFGLPPLEAMACGTPVAASNATSVPEVVGDAGEFFEPTDTHQMFQAMRNVLDSAHRADELRLLGQKRARQFTFERTAEGVLSILRAASNGSRYTRL